MCACLHCFRPRPTIIPEPVPWVRGLMLCPTSTSLSISAPVKKSGPCPNNVRFHQNNVLDDPRIIERKIWALAPSHTLNLLIRDIKFVIYIFERGLRHSDSMAIIFPLQSCDAHSSRSEVVIDSQLHVSSREEARGYMQPWCTYRVRECTLSEKFVSRLTL